MREHMSDRTATSAYFVDDPSAAPLRMPDDVPRDLRTSVRGIWDSLAHRRNIVVILVVGAYVGWFIHLNLVSYYSYGEPPFDLAVFDQGMWLISHFHIPFDTVMGRNLFGDHSSFVLYLFAPFYRLFPEPQGLLVLQTLLLAAPAIPIYVLARKYIKSTVIATSLVATYLLSPLVQQGNLDQFHPEAFQVFFVSVAIYAAIESKSGLLVVMAALMLMVKEDAAVSVVPLGLWVAARRDRRLRPLDRRRRRRVGDARQLADHPLNTGNLEFVRELSALRWRHGNPQNPVSPSGTAVLLPRIAGSPVLPVAYPARSASSSCSRRRSPPSVCSSSPRTRSAISGTCI